MKGILPIFCCLILACRSQVGPKGQNDKMHDPYVYAFKMTYFKKLLQEGFNNSTAINEVLVVDRSGYGELILSLEDENFTDSLVKIDNQTMIQDSLNSIGRVGEGAQGKRIFDFALNRYQGEWLNKLAESRYRIYHRKQNSDSD